MVLEKALKILQQPVCDHCLGRQFAQLLSGYGNEERGRVIRAAAAMSIDQEEAPEGVDMSNFSGLKFHNLEAAMPAGKKCSVCGGLFPGLGKWAERIRSAAKKCEFSTFLVGTKLALDLIEKEEGLWERVGIDHCEPLKAELNRELGKLVEKALGARFDGKKPEVNIIADFGSGKAAIGINPLFVYGEYQKLARGIPQTKWPSGKYRTSVEQIIAKPFMRATKGKAHKLHGMGREDIDARCLGWRPFVLEILGPVKRKIDIRKLAKKIDRKKVRVRNARLSGVAEVREIKEARAEKTYRAVVLCENKIGRKDLKRLRELRLVHQRTPQRVLHRRADRLRKRAVRSVKARLVSGGKFVLEIRSEAGLYIKELVSGDSGRTQPSVSSLLGTKCACRELDVIAIHL